MSTETTDAEGLPLTAAPLSGLPDPHVATVVPKRDFVDRVVAATGARRAEARPIIEATLDQLGQILSAGQTLAVPPLGRARINLERDARGGDVITLRLRRRASSTAPILVEKP
ncbi:DNA-binding protein [Paracoccus gahaiensis]|uniref:DNA-binding protein n=1 Tax=Paracoccus gahaiensis TaxID=1706839 RepID=UPI001FE8CD8D|nr:DNA-binding protein [Paracoccus gahaiensis]